jgi:nanoRNase/pAp phosphatase (c-di-AMP/oligoRNAs hydrolase)
MGTVKITDTLKRHSGERHLIVIHEFPDPDANASAYTHRLMSAAYGIETDIIYSGKISHRQNVALVRLLGIELTAYEPSFSFAQYQGSVFVDNQGTTVNEIVSALKDAGVPVLIVVDHHESQELLTPEFSDIRRVGATATIYASYLEQGPFSLDGSHKDHVVAGTALMHGLLTDTGGFIRADAEDFRAAGYLSRFRDPDLLTQIMSQARPKQVMEIIRRAVGDRVIVENVSIAGIGYLRAEDRDAIPQASEFLMTEENIHTAIVYGIMKEGDQSESLIGSMRTSKITFDPDEFIKDVFGKNKDGLYYGGGKTSAGGFSIPIGFLTGDPDEKFHQMKWEVFDAQVKHKLLTKLGVEQKRKTEQN